LTSPGSTPPSEPGPFEPQTPGPEALEPGALEPMTPADPPVPWVAAPPPASGPPGASTFTIEGRAAPALFVVGWLASLMGLGAILVGVLSGGGLTSTIILGVGLVLLTVGLISASGSQGLDRRARGVLPYRGPSPFLVFAAAVPVSIIAILVAVIPMTLLGIPVDGPFGRLVSVLVQTIVYIALIRLLVIDTGSLSWAEMGVRLPDRAALSEMGAGAIWAIPVIAVTIPVAAILQALFTVTPDSPLPPAGETSGFVLNLIAGAILAPLGEEILFRGLATTAWVRGLGVQRGIVRGALFFAVVHVLTISGGTAGEAFQLAIIGFATRVPVALALGYLFVKRGSIWVPFGLHAAFNGILLVLAEVALRSGVTGAG
jgi:membrane protease YdiL (CAAX protease family)